MRVTACQVSETGEVAKSPSSVFDKDLCKPLEKNIKNKKAINNNKNNNNDYMPKLRHIVLSLCFLFSFMLNSYQFKMCKECIMLVKYVLFTLVYNTQNVNNDSECTLSLR